MTTTLDSQLNESRRDALVAYYLGQYARNSQDSVLNGLKTSDDLYRYLLLDNQVANVVETSPAAQAIASVQQYVNGIVRNMEPGYRQSVQDDDAGNWQGGDNRYSLWAAYQQIQDYPENFIEPTLRLKKSWPFQNLENTLNQNKLDANRVQDAVLGYLNDFETVSNLHVLSGYADNSDFETAKYYFIGRTNAAPYRYYWRSMDLGKNPKEAKKVAPICWSEWLPIDLPLDGDNVLEHTVRPAYFNNRLYVGWVGRNPDREGDDSSSGKGYVYEIKLSYMKYDGGWGAPNMVASRKEEGRDRNDIEFLMKRVFFSDAEESNSFRQGLVVGALDPKANEKKYNFEVILNDCLDVGSISGDNAIGLYDELKNGGRHGVQYFSKIYSAIEVGKGSVAWNTLGDIDIVKELKDGGYRVSKGGDKLICDFILNDNIDVGHGLGAVVGVFLSEEEREIESMDDVKKLAANSKGKWGGIYVEDGHGKGDNVLGVEIEISVLMVGENKLYFCVLDQIMGRGEVKIFEINVTAGGGGDDVEKIKISRRLDSVLGHVQYLEFPKGGKLPADTRLNTNFVRELIRRANLGMDELLRYETQMSPYEADLHEDGKAFPMDFDGANSLYFWELFFHVPLLIASRFNTEQQYDEAAHWLRYIFDPSKRTKDGGGPPYWNVRPLLKEGDDSRMLSGPLDPDAIAYANPAHYRKAVYQAYIRNLIGAADMAYRELTPDGISDAKLRYTQVLDLLGPKPSDAQPNRWRPVSVGELAQQNNAALRALEAVLPVDPPPQTASFEPLALASPWTWQQPQHLLQQQSRRFSALSTLDNGAFRPPLNQQLLSYWDTVESRLYNLRHNLTIDGKPMSLPLFAQPADPRALLAARAQGGVAGGGGAGAMVEIPPYRFRALLPRAYNAVDTLSRFGDGLLSILERGDRAKQEELQQSQMFELSDYAIRLQQEAIDALEADREAILSSRDMARVRGEHYKRLHDENITVTEQQVMDLQTSAQVVAAGANIPRIAAAALSVAPNIYGVAFGGSQYGAPLYAVSDGMMMASGALSVTAERLSISENYRRRRQDWEIIYQQAEGEVEAIDKQLAALDIRLESARTGLRQAQTQQNQLKSMLDYLTSRFTNAKLYQWMAGQMAALYYQAYDAVLSVCRMAEACWQYETGDFVTRFVQPAWNDAYRGLLAGETLRLSLHRMEEAHLKRNERRLELTKTVSLKQLLDDGTGSAKWLDDLKKNGKVEFALTEKLFDGDYPGHYLRQLTTVSVSLPAVLGPYQNVRATLTQSGSDTVLKPDIEAVKSLNGGTSKAGADAIVSNLRASQQIALSSGLNDAGLFQLDFGDERYLPFEGTGAVSRWVLSFPRHDKSDEQQALLASLTDVIVQVNYTALDGGKQFADAVEGTLADKGGDNGKPALAAPKSKRGG